MPIVIPGSEMDVNTPQSRVKADTSQLLGKYRGAQAIAGSLEDVGGAIDNINRDMQRAKDAQVVADASLRMSKAHESMIESFQNDPDPQTWEARAYDTVSQVRQDIYGGKERISSAMKKQLDVALTGWGGSMRITAKTAANVQRVNTSRNASIAAYDDALKNGNADLARQQLDVAREARTMNPIEADNLQREIPKTIAINEIETGATNNPKKTFDDLKAGKWEALDPKAKITAMAHVEARLHDWQAQNLDSVRAEYDSGKLISDADIDQRVKSGEITARGADTLKRFMVGETLKDSKANYDLLNGEILSTDVSTLKPQDRAAWKSNITNDASGLAVVHKNAITRQLDAKLRAIDAKDEKVENKVKSQTIAQMHRDFNEGYVLPGEKISIPTDEVVPGTGFLGFFRTHKTKDLVVPADEQKRRNWMNNADLDTVNGAKVRFAQELGKMDDFFKQHEKDNDGKGPSYEEAEQFRQKLMEPYLAESVSKALTSQIPAQESISKDAYEKLGSGDKYWWNGKQLTKK